MVEGGFGSDFEGLGDVDDFLFAVYETVDDFFISFINGQFLSVST